MKIAVIFIPYVNWHIKTVDIYRSLIIHCCCIVRAQRLQCFAVSNWITHQMESLPNMTNITTSHIIHVEQTSKTTSCNIPWSFNLKAPWWCGREALWNNSVKWAGVRPSNISFTLAHPSVVWLHLRLMTPKGLSQTADRPWLNQLDEMSRKGFLKTIPLGFIFGNDTDQHI